MPKPNPNKIEREQDPKPAPPQFQGARDAPTDTTDWIEVGHREAEAAKDNRDVAPMTHGNAPGGQRPKPPRDAA